MNYIIIKLSQDLKDISSNKRIFKKYFIRKSIKEAKNKLKDLLLNKPSYNGTDIMEFVQLLKSAEILDYIKVDSDLEYKISNNSNSQDVISAILKYSISFANDKMLEISYRIKFDNELDKEGSIDLVWVITDSAKEVIDSQYITENKTSYSKSVKNLYEPIVKHGDISNMGLLVASYCILHSIFVIYIEEIFDGIERKYLNEPQN